MTVDELIRDIHVLNRELEHFEVKYRVLSQDFYRLYIEGKLPDEDVEQIDEFGEWAALYRAKLSRESRYRELVHEKQEPVLSSLG
ncbi:MAG: hypothetical protein HPY83_08410 [Anaerolineae bacterium]|nr:hypothetical protein [Anaerolineae bacterium]